MSKFTILAIAAVLCSACGPRTNVQTLNPPPRQMAARPAASVEVFSAAMPPRPFVEVAIINASRGRSHQHMEALRETAGKMGCDGMIVGKVSTESVAWTASGDSARSVSGSSATCIMWR